MKTPIKHAPHNMNAALLKTFKQHVYTHSQTPSTDVSHKLQVNSQKDDWGGGGEDRRSYTCSTGLRPERHIAGRGGAQSWKEPTISSWYHCSKSSLWRWGLLLSHWYWRAQRGAAGRRRREEKRKKERLESIRRQQEEGRNICFIHLPKL